MAIESVIELKVVGLDELESRLKALNNLTVNFGGGVGGRPPLTAEEKAEREAEKEERKKKREADKTARAEEKKARDEERAQKKKATEEEKAALKKEKEEKLIASKAEKEREKQKQEESKKAAIAFKEMQKQQEVFRKKQEEFTKSLGKFAFDVGKFGFGFVFDVTKKLGGAFMGVTKALVGAGGLIAGISSIISLTGLIKASQDINRRTYQATGFGLSNPNVLRTMQSTYGMFSDVGEMFGALNVAAATPGSVAIPVLADIMSKTGRRTSIEELRGMEPEERAIRTSEAMFAAARNENLRKMLSNPDLVQSLGLEGIAGPEVMNRMLKYSPEQFKEITGIYGERKPYTQMDESTRYAYQKFGARRETGFAAVETQLLSAMRPVLEPIDRLLSAIFSGLNKESSKFRDFVSGLATDIDLFAKAISEGKWGEFFDKIAEQAKAMWEAIKPEALKVWSDIEKFALASWEKVSKWFVEEFPKHADKTWKAVSEWFDAHFKNASNDLRDFLEVIKDLTIILRDLRDLLNQIKKVFWFLNTSLPEEAQQSLDVFSRMSGAGQGPWNFIHNFPTLLGGFSGLYKPTAHEMLQTAQSKIEGATRYFSNEMGFGAAGEGLDYEFLKKLNQMKGAMPPELGGFSISSGHRSEESQQKIWNEAVKKYGSEAAARKWAAKPGSSSHQFGLAADLKFGSDKARKWMHEHASEFGLDFRLQNEDWHIEPIGARERINEMRGSGSYRKSAFRNSTENTPSYTPSGVTGGKLSFGSMFPSLNLRNYNNPQSDTGLQMTFMYGNSLTDNP